MPELRDRLVTVPMADLAISVVTEAELRYGVAKRGNPPRLARLVHEFLIRVEVLPWTSDVARGDAQLRCEWELAGITVAPLDLMIAAHASAIGATLVSRDRVFQRVPGGLTVEDWTAPAME